MQLARAQSAEARKQAAAGSAKTRGRRAAARPAAGLRPSRSSLPVASERVRSGGRALDEPARSRLETGVGQNLAGVRVHDDAAAAASARALGARAYALGDDIVFGAGEYRPSTREGERLLAHEVAHVAHARSVSPRPGIGPADTLAERGASAFAGAFAVKRQAAPLAHDLGSWGPAWRVQLERVTVRGQLEDAALLNYGPGDGDAIDVRSGVEAEWDSGDRQTNMFSLEVEGPHAAQMHWLQFFWMELYADMPGGRLQLEGPARPNTAPDLELTRKPSAPNWAVDSLSPTSPFYEAGAATLRAPTDLTMLDWPGTDAEDFVAGYVRIRNSGTVHTLVFHFDTYLIQGSKAVYHVRWTATTTYTRDAHHKLTTGPRVYHVVDSGRVSAVPTALRKLVTSRNRGFQHVGEPPKPADVSRRRPPRIPRQPFFR